MIGYCEIYLHLPESNSLKSKRKIIKALKDRLKNRFNISIAELDAHDKWQKAVIGIAYINKERINIDKIFNNLINTINTIPNLVLIDYFTDIL